ncbi:MAG: amino acid--tRNA ligase-related protein [Candidatus Roizmanbacteria bacterium]|nr:amino acid--tRNA ligase-related protein [Candidatus Roizmanbacteria bacterium]
MQIKTTTKNLKNYKVYLQVKKAVNEFFEKNNYLKIDLPVLSPTLIPESYLEVFETEFRLSWEKTCLPAGREKLYLTPSPELFLKRLLAYGVGDCYYLGKSFRNSDQPSSLHSFEFMMLEFYKMNANYMDIAEEVLKMLRHIDKKVKNEFVSFKKWEKISVTEAFEKYSDISEKELFDHKLFLKRAEEKGYQIVKTPKLDVSTYKDLWSQIYVQEIEPNLGKNGYPTLIYDYPKEFAALAKLNIDGKTTQRFEFYINGIELGDCYTELTDWREQELRFKKESGVIHPIDKGYIEALKYGLQDCSGIAIGLERLAMIFANVDSIEKLKLINIS